VLLPHRIQGWRRPSLVLARVRVPVGRALGIADDVPLTNEQLAVAIERLAWRDAAVAGSLIEIEE
jgi:hypothetical protein